MAKTSTQIEIPVSLKASLEGLKEVQTQVSQALDKAGKNTTLGKTLAKELSTTAAKFGEIDEILLSPTIDESGLKRLERLADQISSHFAQSFAKIDFSSFEQFATEDQLKHMRELQELTRKQRRELEAINKHGSQERTDTYLTRTGNEVALNHMRNYKGFDATQTLSKNQQAMERLSQSHERTVVGMKKQLAEYEQKADEAFNAWDAADKRVKVLEPQVATLRKDSYAATFYDKIGRMNTRISANPETVNPRISSIEKELGSALRSIEAGGVIATEARDALKDWITHTFTNVNPTEASQMVGMTVNKLLEKLMEKIFGQGYEADREGGYDFSHSALLARGQDFADKSVKRLNAKHSTASASDLALVNQQKTKELREAKAEATTQENAAEHYMDLGMALEAQITETQQAANHTRFLAQELGRYAQAAKRAAQASKQGEINDSEQSQRDYVTQAKQEQEDNYAPSREKYNDTKPGLDDGFEKAGNLQGAAKAAAAEAEDFKKHLQQSIAHWASAQQIINVVKDGIRQAYQDIKALDSAMTNIAVVTDMSVSNLWSKINEYMSIAKQYGVTTQGVYEVSQLYYQQGLSTNEVMAATTETLKMARIAGMGYAEAADAMTVAIRAFKMDMTDAGHVTDVYSKVAAVTASDSEELAIAMSKTASSAESVGSSFENTTSMLAVMVETTRESAQNLGSALKSIISRYGEMKVGLKVDSEGEEIDYNKVDTALKSVGISIKDAQGQFRDFDDVIFELSEKWDSLDKNTQRYIATIMAGNRQQSRFIALVDNWERLEEVSAAAANSADAGLLQYAKTMDSLDTKLNTLKTNFQQFYMSIFNGEFFKGIVDIANNIVTSLSRMGPILGSINLIKLINQIKLIGQLLLNSFSGAISRVRKANKDWQDSFTGGWEGVGDKITEAILKRLMARAKDTGRKFTEGVAQGAEEAKNNPKNPVNTSQQNSSVGNVKYADLSSLAAVHHLVANSTTSSEAVRQSNLLFGLTGLTQGKGYFATAENILQDSSSTKVDQTWARKIIKAKQEYVVAIRANTKDENARIQAAKKAQQAIDTANKERIKAIEQSTDVIEEETKSSGIKGWFRNKDNRHKVGQVAGQVAMTVGTLAQTAALGMDTSTMEGYDQQGWVSGLGGVASAAGQLLTGNWIGAATTAIITIVDVWNHIANRAQVELENAKKAAEKANIERAQKKEEYQSLESYTERLKELNKTRFESDESQAEWIALNNEMAEKYPELISYIDSAGNSIVDLDAATVKLTHSQEEALKANQEYWAAQRTAAKIEMDQLGSTSVKGITSRGGIGGSEADQENIYRSFFADPSYLGNNSGRDVFYDIVGGKTIEEIAASGIKLSEVINVMNTPGNENFRNNMVASGLFAFAEDGDYAVLGDAGKQVLEYQQYVKSYGKSAEILISSTGNLALAGTATFDTLSNISNWEELALINTTASFEGNEGETWRDIATFEVEESYKNFGKKLAEWYSELSQNYQQAFNNILNNIGGYSKDELETELKRLGLDPKEDSEIWNSIMLKYAESRVFSIERWAKLTQGNDFESLEEFKTRNANMGVNWTDEQAADEYIKAYGQGKVANLSTQELDAYINRHYQLAEQVATNSPLKAIFNSQNKLVDNALSLWQNGKLSDEASRELYEIINAEDFGSVDWSKRVQEWEKKWGKDILDEGENIISESFFTYVDGVLDKVDSTLDSFEDIAEKHSKGFTFDEAKDLLRRYQQLEGHANATFNEVFDVLEDGTIVLTNLDKVTNEFYAQQARDMEKASGRAQESIDNLTEYMAHLDADEAGKYSFNALQKWEPDDIQTWLTNAGVDPTMIAYIIKGIADGTIKTWNDVIDFLNRTKEEVDAGREYYNKQAYKAKFTNWKNTKYNKAQDINFDLIGATWAVEYQITGGDLEDTDAFNQFMEGKLAQIEGAFIDASGNLIITDANAFIKYLNSTGLVDESTLQTYTAQIEDAAIKTVTSIFDLITKAIEGTLTASELVSLGEKLVNSGRMSAEEWSKFAQANVTKVGTGYKMNEAAAFVLQVNTGDYDFEDLINQFDDIDEVNEMLIELQKNSAEWGNEFVRAAERVLESIRLIKAQDPKDAMFNWMNQDMEGWAGTYESTIGSIGKANDIINASMESGTMGLNDFYNMSQIVGQHLTGTQLDAWNQYRDAVYATATTVDGGTVSLTAGGKSMEYALDAMQKSTEAYYQKIAKQQIDFIDKQIAALEAQKKVEEALKGDSGNSNAALNREDLIYTGIAGDIGLYSEEEYAAAEKKWYGRNRVPGEDEYDPNAPEAGTAFAATVSKYIGEATQDALKAGLDITDAQVQQQIKDSAMARAGISGYSDTLTDKNLAVLTTISGDVAAIKKEVVQEAPSTTEQNPGGTGTANNGSGSGNGANYDNPQTVVGTQDPALREQEAKGVTQQSQEQKEEQLSNTKEEQNIEQQTLAEDQQQTQHQVNIDTNTDATVTTLKTTNSLLEQDTGNTEKKVDTPGPEENDTTGSGEEGTTTTETTTTGAEPPPAPNLYQEIANQIERYGLYKNKYREAGLELDYLHIGDYIKAYQMYMQARGTPVESAPVYSDQQLLELPSLLEFRYNALSDALENLGLFPEGLDPATFKQEARQLIHSGSLEFDEDHPFANYKFGPGDYWKDTAWLSHLNTQSLNNRLSDEEILAIMQQEGPEHRGWHFAELSDDDYRTLEAAYSVGELSDEDWQLVQKWLENSQYYALKENEYYAEQEAEEAQRLAQEEYSRNYRDKHVNYESFVDVTTPPPLTDEAIRNALYWMDVREGKYDNWTEETPDITTPKKPPEAMAPKNYIAVPPTTAEDLAQDLQQAGDRVVQGFEQLLAGGAEAWSRVMGEEPTLSESQLEVKTIADATLSALDNLDNYNDNGELDQAAAITEISKVLQKPPEEWMPLLQKDLGPGGTAKTYLSDGDIYKLQTDFIPMTAFDTTVIQEDIQNAIIEAQKETQMELDNNPTNLSVGADTQSAKEELNQLTNTVTNTSPSVNIKVGFTYGGAVSDDLGGNGMANTIAFDLAQRLGFATGNVNGLAFATGTEKLIAGANLANKSLVGELGPELAVYNGQYHLLGANGAEFANIPSNAIIFNHKQTEGILKGQANIRGRVKDGGEAFAEGNVSGPAYASGIDEAIAALQEARAMWQSLLDTPLDKIIGRNKASGGGSGIAAVDIGELEEWYNLLRQIEAIQDKINLLVAERNNLEAEYNGEATLRNLRQQQSLLEKQRATQEQLMKYQRIQLERQKNEILNDPVWNKFLTFDESTGAIQYTKGNELFGGKGAWEFLQDLDQMSAKEQIAAINKLGYTAKDKEGKQLTGEELVKHFVDAAKNIEEEYRNLDNTVRESETELENIDSNINEIEQTIRDNEMALEQNVFDTIVDAWEANIEALEEQKDLIEEANDAYVEGLREALDAERKAYEDEASVADREQLQRELSLLRRSGGSASEIADLEEQIDNALKDEYFKSQEDMIADIEEANKNQIELLEKQIQIEEETLEYQKENGVIWQQVATILSGTKESIMAFLSGSAPGFFAQSKNQQIDALNEWSYMVGLYKEDQFIKNTSAQTLNDMNSSDGKMWGYTDMSGYYEKFSGSEMTDEERKSAADAYATEYAKLLSEGKTEEQAAEGARKVLRDRIDQYSTPDPEGGDIVQDSNQTSNGKKAIKVSISAADGHGKPYVKGPIYSGQQYSIYPNANSGYQFLKMTVDGTVSYSMNFKAGNKDMVIKVSYKKIEESGSGEETGMLPSLHGYKITYVDRASNETKTKKSGRLYTSTAIAQREGNIAAGDMGLFNKDKYKDVKITAYKTGGLVDYTGLAMVHGSSSKPEAFLNAEQTAQIKDALMLQTKDGLLSSLQDSLLQFQSTIDGTVSGITSEANNSSINIQPGAVVIQVEELANNYDVEKLSNDVMNRMTAIAAKATNRGVNRR